MIECKRLALHYACWVPNVGVPTKHNNRITGSIVDSTVTIEASGAGTTWL